jgi:hypothetical protein
MDPYINNDTVIKDDIYKTIEELILCPLCHNILIEPVICLKCQKSFCKKCINKLTDIKCPNNCETVEFPKCISKNEILTKLKFKCKYCQSILSYDDALKHKNVCNKELIDSFEIIEDYYPTVPKKKAIKKLNQKQIAKLKKKYNMQYINSKY